jgi:excisionase family DNA binding protein
MKTYSISEAARVLRVGRRTLQRWVSAKAVPAPADRIVEGKLLRFWTEDEMEEIRKHKDEFYWGKGMYRRKGKRAKQRKK